MRLLIFTDNHFCTNSSIIRSIGDKYSVRLENQIQSLNWVNNLALERNCSAMIHLGDFFDRPDLTAQEISALKDVRWNNLPKFFLVGNHEMGSNDLSFNSVNILNRVGTVIDKPSIDIGFGYQLIYLPYILECNRKPLKDYISEIYARELSGKFVTQEYKYTIILSHNDLAGLQLGKYVSKAGFNIEEIEECCDLFINGHLHNQTRISEKILNLGNLTGQNFSEDGFNYKHSALILDTDTLSLELVDNPYAFYFYKIEADNLEDLKNKVSGFSKNYSIGTIKIPGEYLVDARKICEEHFKEFRILTTTDFSNLGSSDDISTLVKVDHISQFKDYILSTLDNSDELIEELDLIK